MTDRVHRRLSHLYDFPRIQYLKSVLRILIFGKLLADHFLFSDQGNVETISSLKGLNCSLDGLDGRKIAAHGVHCHSDIFLSHRFINLFFV